jgi:hypothetical protein
MEDAALRIAEMLLERGADPMHRDKSGKRVIDSARGKAMRDLVERHLK